jgi:hypothetical protein
LRELARTIETFLNQHRRISALSDMKNTDGNERRKFVARSEVGDNPVLRNVCRDLKWSDNQGYER